VHRIHASILAHPSALDDCVIACIETRCRLVLRYTYTKQKQSATFREVVNGTCSLQLHRLRRVQRYHYSVIVVMISEWLNPHRPRKMRMRCTRRYDCFHNVWGGTLSEMYSFTSYRLRNILLRYISIFCMVYNCITY
jgi:hypothetical protein